ncbi:hypothetical protein B0H11DRAFT_1909297 [Mycena galericulata]|nr:hypothetical protein B0H11DRAFT_1909297 [Mycena galericulata]
MPSVSQNGVIIGTPRPENNDADYPTCNIPFFPTYSFGGVGEHEREDSECYYYLVSNTKEARVYSESDARNTGVKLLKDVHMSTHRGLSSVSHAIYDWCKEHHHHSIPARRSERSKTVAHGGIFDLTTYKPPIPTRPVSPASSASHALSAHRAPLMSARHFPYRRSPTPIACLAERPGSPTAPAHDMGWFVLSNGEVFVDAAKAEEAIKDRALTMKIARDLDEGTAVRAAWALHTMNRLREARNLAIANKNKHARGENEHTRERNKIDDLTRRIRVAAAEYCEAQRTMGEGRRPKTLRPPPTKTKNSNERNIEALLSRDGGIDLRPQLKAWLQHYTAPPVQSRGLDVHECKRAQLVARVVARKACVDSLMDLRHNALKSAARQWPRPRCLEKENQRRHEIKTREEAQRKVVSDARARASKVEILMQLRAAGGNRARKYY